MTAAVVPADSDVQAWFLDEGATSYRLGFMEAVDIGVHDVVVEPRASALNHMDHWLTQGRPRPPRYPHIGGGDGAGVVVAVGAEAGDWVIGDEVIIDPSVVSLEAHLRGIDAPLDPSLQILGEHRWGTHAERVVVPHWQLHRRPPHRSWEECAALPVASVTAWRMLRRGRVQPGDRVLVVGVGGGVAAAALSIAVHLGAEVTVTSSDGDKRDWALTQGAVAAVDSHGEFPRNMDVVVESVGPATWDRSVAALARGGRMVVCGGTSGATVELNLPRLFFKQHEVIGSTMGSPPEFADLLAAFADGLDVAIDRVVDWDDYPAALEALRAGRQVGKLVLRHR